MLALTSDIRALAGAGKSLAQHLKPLGIITVRDLIFYLPYRFDDFTRLAAISDLKAGESVTIRGTIRLIKNRRSWKTKKIVTEALISDDTGEVNAIWFNQPFIVKNLRAGDYVSFSGKTSDNFYTLQLISPAYEKIKQNGHAIHTGGLVPVYSLTAKVSQKKFRECMKRALDECEGSIQEFLPLEIISCERIMPLASAIRAIHFPTRAQDFLEAKKRLAFDELLLLHLFVYGSKKNLQAQHAPAIAFNKALTQSLLHKLPFELTKSQKKVSWEILQDIAKEKPMNRLLQGDVGAGKTVIAALVTGNVIEHGYQVAYMAPTEVLAKQHIETFSSYFKEFPFSLALLSSSVSHTEKKRIRAGLRDGTISLVIGTHALLEESVSFHNLGLAIIDEQHRFGVGQRKKLRERNAAGSMPHLLSMTATPIPRSLALTVYGDLDISILEGLPHGRKKIISKIVPQKYREWVYEFIRREVKKGHQAFIIFPLIDPSDALGVRSVTQEYERLTAYALARVRVGILHGKMKPAQKDDVMRAFLEKKIDVLLSTSVVEVGLDIPNASVILIEGAERFGLAQLHQFRGRVGRALVQSYCFLLPTQETHESKARLKIFASSSDGFYLAEKDLELRGQGDIYGFRQSGMPFLQIADIKNVALIKKTKEYAVALSGRMDEHPDLQERIGEMSRDVHLE